MPEPVSSGKALTLYCQVFHPDGQSTAQLFADWTSGLAARGWDIRVICGFPPGDGVGRVPARERWRGVEIRRVGVRLDFKRSLGFRAIHYAAYMGGAALELLKDPDRLALVVTNPPFLPVWASFFRKLCRGRYALEIQDLYPDGLVALGVMREGMIVKFWRSLNGWAFRNAEFTVALGRDMAGRLRSIYGLDSEKTHVIPHWSPVEPADGTLAGATALFRELGLEHRFVVQYSGNMGLWHDLEQIVEAAVFLRGREDICFLMVGGGRRRASAECLASEHDLSNIRWLPFQPKDRLADSLSACHAALISQRNGLEGLAVPCKLYGILASGRPVIAAVPGDSEIARVVLEEDCGLLVRPGDAMMLARAIVALADDPARAHEMGRRAREAYLKKYTLAQALDRFETCCQPPSDRR
ncbi:MAG: glycosyltransferase family 4 protein [Terrimicrobiaceae bacterium]